MRGFCENIEKLTAKNNFFRIVLYTAKNSQLVLMNLKPLEEIGEEVHRDGDQFFRFEKGVGKVVIDGNEHEIKPGEAVIVPSGARHNVINTSKFESLKFYTIYSPPHHKDTIIHKTKAEAEKDSEHFDGLTSE